MIWSLFRLFLLGCLFFCIFQFYLDNCMNLYYNCIKIINTVKTHHTVHTEKHGERLRCLIQKEGLYDHTGLSGPASDL